MVRAEQLFQLDRLGKAVQGGQREDILGLDGTKHFFLSFETLFESL